MSCRLQSQLLNFLLGLVLFGFAGCTKKVEVAFTHEIEKKSVKMPEGNQEFYLPSKLWDIMTGAKFEKIGLKTVSFTYAPLDVILEEKSDGVLSSPGLKLEFPNGGGEVDLSQFVKNTKGTFRLKFGFEGFSFAEDLKVFYISNGRQRKIDDEIYGSGCSSYFDMREHLIKVNSGQGIELNVTRDRHITTLAGRFVFSYKRDRQNYISQVTFLDSTKPQLFCNEPERKTIKVNQKTESD